MYLSWLLSLAAWRLLCRMSVFCLGSRCHAARSSAWWIILMSTWAQHMLHINYISCMHITIYVYIYIYTPWNYFEKNGRRPIVVACTPEACIKWLESSKNAGEFSKLPELQICGETRYVKTRTSENYGGRAGNYTRIETITPAGKNEKHPADQNCWGRCKNAGKHEKAPFTRQSCLF